MKITRAARQPSTPSQCCFVSQAPQQRAEAPRAVPSQAGPGLPLQCEARRGAPVFGQAEQEASVRGATQLGGGGAPTALLLPPPQSSANYRRPARRLVGREGKRANPYSLKAAAARGEDVCEPSARARKCFYYFLISGEGGSEGDQMLPEIGYKNTEPHCCHT